MDSYTITIAPNDDSGNATTLVVDTSGDQVRITDVHLHAAGGLTGGQLPTVDFELLLRAVGTPAASPAPIEAAPATTDAVTPAPEVVEAPSAPATSARPRPGARPRTTKRAAKRASKTAAVLAPEPAPEPEPAKRPRTRRAVNAAPPAAPASPTGTTPTARKASATRKATARKAAAKETSAPAETGGRVYRRMPDDFAGVYRQAGTAAAIADHYAVPRHTAQGWIRRQKSIDAAAGN
jgi:hypothetical protein